MLELVFIQIIPEHPCMPWFSPWIAWNLRSRRILSSSDCLWVLGVKSPSQVWDRAIIVYMIVSATHLKVSWQVGFPPSPVPVWAGASALGAQQSKNTGALVMLGLFLRWRLHSRGGKLPTVPTPPPPRQQSNWLLGPLVFSFFFFFFWSPCF